MPLGKRNEGMLGLGIFLRGCCSIGSSACFPDYAANSSENKDQVCDYDGVGYRRLAVEGVGFTNDCDKFRAQRVEGSSFGLVLAHHFFPARSKILFAGERMELDISPSTTNGTFNGQTNRATVSVHNKCA